MPPTSSGRRGPHPWFGQLAADDEAGFADFLARLYHSQQPAQFIGHLCEEGGEVRHVLWSGQYVPAQQMCCGWIAPLDTTRSTQLPADLSQQLPLLQDPLLTQLAQALSARTGLDFFNTLVNQLAHILVADAVWLAERTGGGRLKVLACHGIDLKEYELDGMPCQQVYLAGRPASFPGERSALLYRFQRGRVTTACRCVIATARSWVTWR